MMQDRPPISITLTPGTIAMAVLILIGFWVLYYLRDVLLIVLTAVVLASSIEPPALRLMRLGLPRSLAVVLMYLIGFVSVLAMFYFFVPKIVTETTALIRDLPTYLETLKIPLDDPTLIVSEEGVPLTQQLGQFQSVLTSSSESIWKAASKIFGSLMSLTLIIVLSFYFAVQERGLDDFLRLITPMRKHDYIIDLWRRAQKKIGRWLQGQLFLSFIVGLFVYVGLLIMGVPYALLLGIIAAVLELIPVFGSILAAVPAVVVAFIDADTSKALLVIVLYVVVNQVQGNIIYPLVVQKILGVSPLVVILAIIAGANLGAFFGSWFLGVLIAVPVAAAIQEYLNDVQRGRQQLSYPTDDGVVI
jgi:predicted PurR-regulated permease PerM